LISMLLVGLVIVACFGGVGFGLIKGGGLALQISLEPGGPSRLGRIGLFVSCHLIFVVKYGLDPWVLVKTAMVHGMTRLVGWFLTKKYDKLPSDVVKIMVYVVHSWYFLRSAASVEECEQQLVDTAAPAAISEEFEL
jgi:hypothetical protein